LNIRKLRDDIDEKNFEVENLNRQIRLKNEELKSEVFFYLLRLIIVEMS